MPVAGRSLDPVELPDDCQRLCARDRRRRHCLLEVPSGMRHASDFDNPVISRKHVVIGGRRIHLEIPTVTGQHLQRPVTIARPGKIVHHLAQLAPIDPQMPGPNLWRATRVLHIQGRVVALNPRRLAHLLPVYGGSSKSATAPFHSESVRRVICTPWRSKICSSRYNGKCSEYLEVTTCANNPGPGRPFSMDAPA